MKKVCNLLVVLFAPYHLVAQPLIEVAKLHYTHESWELAYTSYKNVLEINPYNDMYWYRYANVAEKINHLDEAIEAYRKTITLNTAHGLAMYRLASCYARKGDTKNALMWLEKAYHTGLYDIQSAIEDQNFKSLHSDNQFKTLTRQLFQPATNQIQAWRQDLEYLVEQVEKEHKNFTHSISSKEWQNAVQKIHNGIPQMTDLEIIGAFMELLAKIGDGHTLLYPPFQGTYAFKALPLEFYFFEDELYVRAAEPEYRSLVGAKVEKVGSMSIKAIMDACKNYLGHDNDMQLKWIMPVALGFGDIYELIGASKNRDSIAFTLQFLDGHRKTVSVKSGSLTRDPMARFAPSHWVDLQNSKIPLWKKDPENQYWYEYLTDRKIVYFQFNQVQNKPEQSLADFVKELVQFINKNEVKALVLDIRLNNGGNSFLNRSLIHEIIRNKKINTHGKLFTIIGRRTFSAAMNLTSDLEKNTATLFVGEPTGSSPNFYGEDNEFTLPNSGLTGSISSRYWQGGYTSDDTRTWIAPHLAASLSLENYRNNEDPALEAIFTYLEASKSE
ncbi:TPR end-of-group domain-containing protein [Ulvibacterium sp.]|uniref:TPR end-of-group domain-containing protein n=1 Tax=Ulvibacterium sp. TaxID=2665914 RepID=UPI003CC51FFC